MIAKIIDVKISKVTIKCNEVYVIIKKTKAFQPSIDEKP